MVPDTIMIYKFHSFVYTYFNDCKYYYVFQAIQSNISNFLIVKMSANSIWLIFEILLRSTNPAQKCPESYGNEGVLYIPQNVRTGDSVYDGLEPYIGYLFGGGLTSGRGEAVYSTAPATFAQL